MKHYNMEHSRKIKAQNTGRHEDVFFRDEGDDRVNPGFMLFPLLILQGLTLLSILL